jgi:hypothetical protein
MNMERDFEEKVKKMNVEELMRFLERGGVYALLGANEGLRRFEEGDPKIEKNFLISVLKTKIKGKMEEKGKELKKIATQILIEKFFDEKSVEEIIDCEDLEKEEREEVAKKYIGLGGKDKNVLMAIIKSNLSPEIKNLAGEKLLTRKLKNKELFFVVQETTVEIQLKALKIFLRKSKNLDDRIELIEIEKAPRVVEITWEKTLPMIMKKNPRKRAEIFFDILKYADSEKIKKNAANEMWIIREILNEEELDQLYENADLITIDDPAMVKKWIDENSLEMPFKEESFEKLKKIIERTKYREIRERAIEKAIEEGEKEIAKKKYSENSWDQKRVEFLKEEVAKLKKEKEFLKLYTEESPILV